MISPDTITERTIAITGGIASGKSSVAGIIEGFGYPVFFADAVSKDILFHDEEIQRTIAREFGSDIFDGGTINKKLLAERAFSSEQSTKKINGILHPAVINKLRHMTQAALLEADFVFVESALVFEADITALFRFIILVTAPTELRIERAMQSMHLSENEVLSRIQQQIPDELKRKKCNFEIVNSGDFSQLTQRVAEVLRQLRDHYSQIKK